MQVIRRTIGFGLLNSMVLRVLERWIRRTLLLASALIKVPSSGVSNDQEDPEWWEPTFPAMEDRLSSVRGSMLESLATLTNRCLLRRAEAPGLGPDHPDALSSMHALAGLRRLQGRTAEALDLCISCMRRRELALGRKHRDTRRSAFATVMLHRERGDTAAGEAVQAEYGLIAAPARRGWAGLRGHLSVGGGSGVSLKALGVAPQALTPEGASSAVAEDHTASGKMGKMGSAGAKLAAIVKLRRLVSPPQKQHNNDGEGGVAAAGQGGADI